IPILLHRLLFGIAPGNVRLCAGFPEREQRTHDGLYRHQKISDVKSQYPMKSLHRAILAISGVALLAVIALPIWRIELDAAQYPEGLELLIYSYKLDGQVDIINGLNHYIGMKVLHAEDFIEFTVLPYLIGVYGLAFILVGLLGRRRLLYILFGAFLRSEERRVGKECESRWGRVQWRAG